MRDNAAARAMRMPILQHAPPAMSMKKSDLDKQLALKIGARMRSAGAPDRYGQSAAMASARREQRQRDADAGLVPFACKLPAALAQRLGAEAAAHPGGLNALVAEYIDAGLGANVASAASPLSTSAT